MSQNLRVIKKQDSAADESGHVLREARQHEKLSISKQTPAVHILRARPSNLWPVYPKAEFLHAKKILAYSTKSR